MSSAQNPTPSTPVTPTTPAAPGTRLLDPIDAPSDSPPAYNLVVDPRAPIPNMGNNPYHPPPSSSYSDPHINPEDNDPNDPDDTPEITINAATQIKGHHNIVSVSTLDAPTLTDMIRALVAESGGSTNLNITINSGTTIIGDRNIVGPEMGEITRQMLRAKAAGTFPKRAGSEPRQTTSRHEDSRMGPGGAASSAGADMPVYQAVRVQGDLARTVFRDEGARMATTESTRDRHVSFAAGTKRSASVDGEENEGKRAREE